MTSDPVWFLWPISTGSMATAACLSLHLSALRNGRSANARIEIVIAGALTFVLPALASVAFIRTPCNPDTGNGNPTLRAPGFLLVAIVAASLVSFRWLRAASGPAKARWLLPVILLGLTLFGVFVESLVGFVVVGSCEFEEPRLGYWQAGIALLVPAVVIPAVLLTRSPDGDLPGPSRAW